MRIVVIDARVAIKWFSREEGSDAAIRLLHDENILFVAPDVFRLEVINGLLRQSRENGLPDDLVDRTLIEVEAAMPHLVPASAILDRAVGLAREMRHPIYDCLYLALAERWDTVLITADLAFVERCRAKLVDQSILDRLRTLEDADLT